MSMHEDGRLLNRRIVSDAERSAQLQTKLKEIQAVGGAQNPFDAIDLRLLQVAVADPDDHAAQAALEDVSRVVRHWEDSLRGVAAQMRSLRDVPAEEVAARLTNGESDLVPGHVIHATISGPMSHALTERMMYGLGAIPGGVPLALLPTSTLWKEQKGGNYAGYTGNGFLATAIPGVQVSLGQLKEGGSEAPWDIKLILDKRQVTQATIDTPQQPSFFSAPPAAPQTPAVA